MDFLDKWYLLKPKGKVLFCQVWEELATLLGVRVLWKKVYFRFWRKLQDNIDYRQHVRGKPILSQKGLCGKLLLGPSWWMAKCGWHHLLPPPSPALLSPKGGSPPNSDVCWPCNRFDKQNTRSRFQRFRRLRLVMTGTSVLGESSPQPLPAMLWGSPSSHREPSPQVPFWKPPQLSPSEEVGFVSRHRGAVINTKGSGRNVCSVCRIQVHNTLVFKAAYFGDVFMHQLKTPFIVNNVSLRTTVAFVCFV